MKKKPNGILNYIKILSQKEKLALYLSILILSVGLVSWSIFYYFDATKKAAAEGGEFTEGMLGKPIYINPILSQNNEVDGTISSLIFSSLLKYDKNSKLINDLTENYQISDDKKTYTFQIRKDARWHDGNPLTANDVFFTIKLIQDNLSTLKLNADWKDIRVELVDEHTIEFILDKPYSPFLNKLTVGILPQHIFKDISYENFLVSEFNLKPVGSGPFIFNDFKQDKQENIISYQLIANNEYYESTPYLEKVNFNFYDSQDSLIEAYNKKEINGFGLFDYGKIQQFEKNEDTVIKNIKNPRYFAIFFNQNKSVPLAEKKVRKALSYAIDKKAFMEQIFYNQAAIQIDSPIIPEFGDIKPSNEAETYSFDQEKAKELLREDGWEEKDGGWKKGDDELKISLISTSHPVLNKTLDIIKSQWEAIGVKVEASTNELASLQQNFIRPREYQALLFGQEYFGNDPDPYHFWHSKDKQDPGNNIAMFSSDELDSLLETTREKHDISEKQTAYAEIEQILAEEKPAHFLYSVNYVYVVNKKIKGFETNSVVSPIFKFNNILDWHISTKRIRK